MADYVPSPQRVGTGGISNGYGNHNRFVVIGQANYATTIANHHNVALLGAFEQRQDWSRNADLRRIYDFYTIDQINAASGNGMTNGGGEGQSCITGGTGTFQL